MARKMMSRDRVIVELGKLADDLTTDRKRSRLFYTAMIHLGYRPAERPAKQLPAGRRRKPKGWRWRYEVWCQAEGRDRDDREYAAKCHDCGPEQRQTVIHFTSSRSPWLVETAGDRREAWDVCWEHEQKVHGAK